MFTMIYNIICPLIYPRGATCAPGVYNGAYNVVNHGEKKYPYPCPLLGILSSSWGDGIAHINLSTSVGAKSSKKSLFDKTLDVFKQTNENILNK